MSAYTTPANRKPGQPIVQFLLEQLKPKGPLFTPFNIITVPIILWGIVFIIQRLIFGIGSMTNMNQEFPWGIWIGFDVVTGVAFAGGAWVLTSMVYVFRMDKYHGLVRATVLNGLLAYCFYAGALLLDLGRYWNIVNPIIGNKFGYNSVLFLVSWHFMLYMMTEAVEFSPAVAQWLGMGKLKKILAGLTLGAVIFGVCLSLLHQSGLGALFLIAKGKIHPLWYNEFIPLLFVVSSVFSGLSVVIIEGTISHKVFHHLIPRGQDPEHHNKLMFGLAKVAIGAQFVYLGMQGSVFLHGNHWSHLLTGWGAWYLFELLGLVLVPMLMFGWGVKNRKIVAIRTAAIMTMVGIIVNRLNISVIAFKWYAPVHYVPSIGEIVVTLTVIFTELWIFRWIILRMPVLDDGEHHHEPAPAAEPVAAEAK